MAFAPERNRGYSVSFFDLETHRILVRYDPGTGRVFASNGGGTLTVVMQESADRYTVIETVRTARVARTIELDPRTHHIFVVPAEYGPAPAPTQEQPRPRPTIVPGSFSVLEFGKWGQPDLRRPTIR